MTHIITTYGGGEVFTLIFNGIAALFKTDSTGMVMPLIRVGLTVGSVYVVILMLFKQQLEEGLRWFLWVVVATNLIFLPKTIIFIHDPLLNTKNKVDNVPFALGAFASLVSQAGKTITEKFESTFSLPDYMPYHKTGTVFASSLMSQVGHFRIIDPIFRGNIERFVNQCVVYPIMIGHKYTLTELQNSPDIWKLVTTQASPVLGFLYQEAKVPGRVITCKEGAGKLDGLWKAEIKRATAIYGSQVQSRKITEAAFNTSLLGSARLLTGALSMATDATDILKQEMMIKAIEDGSNNKLSELGSPSNYAATKALLQQRSAYSIAGEIAARTLPLFKNVIEALSYTLFIFIVILALLPNGYRILLTYCGILAWIQLWAPLYAVLNLIMTLYGKAETIGHGAKDGLTLLNSSAIINANADMVTLAAWLSVSIPFISYGILKQGAGAFVGLAQHLGSAMQSAASGAASEVVSGNISLGNVSMGTQAYQNTTAFQHNTSPSYNASQFKSMGASGIEANTFVDGTQAFNDYGTSNLPVKLIASVNSSFEQQQRLHEAESVANSKSIAAGKSWDSALQKTANVLERLGSDISKNESYSQNLTSNEAQALQDHDNFTNDISQSMGVTKARAHELAFSVAAGVPNWVPISGGFSTNASGTDSHQDQIQEAQAIANQKGYSYSVDSVLSAAQSIMEDRRDTEGVEFAKSASSTLNEATHLRDEASVAQNKVKEISESSASTQRRDFQETRDVTQPFLEYIASQPTNERSGALGMERALHILKQGGAEYQNHLQQFQEANPHYSIQRIDTQQEGQALNSHFGYESTQLKAQATAQSQRDKNMQYIDQQRKELGLEKSQDPDPSFQEKVKDQLLNNTNTIDQRQENLTHMQGQLQDNMDEAKGETFVVGNLKNIGKSLSGGYLGSNFNPLDSSPLTKSSPYEEKQVTAEESLNPPKSPTLKPQEISQQAHIKNNPSPPKIRK